MIIAGAIVGLIEIVSIVVALACGLTCCFTKDDEERDFAAREFWLEPES